MKIAICDDKIEQIEIIRAAAERYLDERGITASIATFDKAFDFLDARKKDGYDLVLLDICMPGLLGTDVAREIRQQKDLTEIIFLTTSDEFAVDAFTLKAAHYLLKPFGKAEFDEAMDRAVAKISDRAAKTITVDKTGGGVATIDIDAIQYIESHDHVLEIVLTGGARVEARETLLHLLGKLQELSVGQFINPYKGYIVNQRAIVTIGTNNILVGCGERIPLPRGSVRKIQADYLAFCFEKRKG